MYELRNNLPLLYDFYIVAKDKSFTNAAKNNYTSQSSLSRSVKKLEDILNVALFIRNNNSIELTVDGERLYSFLDGIFNDFNNSFFIEEQDDEKLFGSITIGTTRNIADNRLATYLTKFNKKYPNVKIKILTDNATNLNDFLINHKIDVLLDYLPQINYSEKYNIKVKNIGEFKTCFACSKDFYNREVKKIKDIKELSNYPLVISGSSRRRQILDHFLQNNDIELQPDIEMPDSKLMANFVTNNDYIGYFIEEEVNDYGLQKIALDCELPANYIGLIYMENTINNITKKFIEIIEKDI